MRYLLHLQLIVMCTVGLTHTMAVADVVPPGYKGVRHEMVFEDSELFARHRIVAAPIAGFHGVVRVEPGVPFSFSSKYGTRLYLVPEDVSAFDDFDRERFDAWVNCPPPRAETRNVLITSPVARLLTTVRLVRANDTELLVEEVSHAALDGSGRPVTGARLLWTGGIIAAGVVVVVVTLIAMRRRAQRSGGPQDTGTADAG